jgi:hypothetical protein
MLPELTKGACASSGKKMQKELDGVAIQLAGASWKNRMSFSAL